MVSGDFQTAQDNRKVKKLRKREGVLGDTSMKSELKREKHNC